MTRSETRRQPLFSNRLYHPSRPNNYKKMSLHTNAKEDSALTESHLMQSFAAAAKCIRLMLTMHQNKLLSKEDKDRYNFCGYYRHSWTGEYHTSPLFITRRNNAQYYFLRGCLHLIFNSQKNYPAS